MTNAGQSVHTDRSPLGTGSWSILVRLAVSALASTSIACLLVDFYGLCAMRTFTLRVAIPAFLILGLWAFADRLLGNGRLWGNVLAGGLAGLLAALAYDIFRLPFVFAHQWGLEHFIPRLNLFKVFPEFGALLLQQPPVQATYSMAVHVAGWAYHFSNGVSFGIMYLALLGDAKRRHWAWGALFALLLEVGMLLTPYPRFFEIALTPGFVVVTLAAHLLFGLAMGRAARLFCTAFAPR